MSLRKSTLLNVINLDEAIHSKLKIVPALTVLILNEKMDGNLRNVPSILVVKYLLCCNITQWNRK